MEKIYDNEFAIKLQQGEMKKFLRFFDLVIRYLKENDIEIIEVGKTSKYYCVYLRKKFLSSNKKIYYLEKILQLSFDENLKDAFDLARKCVNSFKADTENFFKEQESNYQKEIDSLLDELKVPNPLRITEL